MISDRGKPVHKARKGGRTFSFRMRDDAATVVAEEPEAFLSVARNPNGMLVFDETGKRIGKFLAEPSEDLDEAPGLTGEDREDLRDAIAAREDIRLNGSIPWEQVKAELGI